MQIFIKLFLISLCIGYCYGADFVLVLNCTSAEECNNFLNEFTNEVEERLRNNTLNETDQPVVSFQDLDECQNNLHSCTVNSQCLNVYGSFECRCLQGFQFENSSSELNCTDIDECSNAETNDCTSNEQCVNLVGSFECRCLADGTAINGRCPDTTNATESTIPTTTLSIVPVSTKLTFPATTIDLTSTTPTTIITTTTSTDPTTSITPTTIINTTTLTDPTTTTIPTTSSIATTSTDPTTTTTIPTTSSIATTSTDPTTTTTIPTTSSIATTSTDPTTSFIQTTSSDLTTSSIPTTLTDPTTSAITTTSTILATSTGLTTSSIATTPTDPTTSTITTPSTDPATPSTATTSADSTTSTILATSTDPTTSSIATTSTDPTTSTILATSTDPTTPSIATTPTDPTTPSIATTPTDPTILTIATTSTILTTSTDPTTPSIATTSADPTTLTIATTSTILATSTDPTTSTISATSTDLTTSFIQTTSADPTTLTDPTLNSIQTTSTDPTTSSIPTTLTDPTTSAITTTSTILATSTGLTTSSIATTPTDPTTSTITTTSTDPATPSIATTSADSTTSTILATSTDPTTSSIATTSTDPTTSTILATSTDPTTPSIATTPTDPTTPSIATTPTDPTILTIATTSTILTTSTDPTTPSIATTSADPTTLTIATTSTILATSTDPTTSTISATSTDLTTSFIQTTSADPTTLTDPTLNSIQTTSTDPTTSSIQTTSTDPTTSSIQPTSTDPTTSIDVTRSSTTTTSTSPTRSSTTTTSTSPIITTSLVPSNDLTTTVNSTVLVNIGNIESGAVSNEEALEFITDLTSSILENPVNEEEAQRNFNIFDAFATSPVTYESSVSSQITRLAEEMLNNMIIVGESFSYSTSSLNVAAFNINRNTTLAPFISSFDNTSTTGSNSIALPQSLYRRFTRISFTGYRNARLFQEDQVTSITNSSFNFDLLNGNQIINSGVIGSAINGTTVMNLDDPVEIALSIIVESVPEVSQPNMTSIRRSLYNPTCVFYDYSANGNAGGWSRDGCVTIINEGTNEITCQCNHLTNFAVIMSVETIIDDHILTILTYVGCSLSIFGLVVSILTYSMFRQLRKHKSKQILLHFCVALLGVYIVYLLGITVDLPANQSQCIANGFFLHFFVAATFAWMLVEVLDMYLMFVKVWSEINSPVKKASLFAWGFPFLLAIVTLGAHFALERVYPGEESRRLYPLYRDTVTCWLSELGLYWAFFLPLGIILLINLVFFCIVVYHVTCKRASNTLTRSSSSKRKIKARQHLFNATAILLLTGPTWIIGFLINLDPISDGTVRRILAYVFVILNAFQGLWIFIVFTIRPKTVRNAWIGFLTGKTKLNGSSRGGALSYDRRSSTTSSYFSRLTKRKSSAGIRSFATTNSKNTIKEKKSKNPTEKQLSTAVTSPSTKEKQYRYSNSPLRQSDSSSDSGSFDRKSSAKSDTNLVIEDTTAAVNSAYNTDEKISSN